MKRKLLIGCIVSAVFLYLAFRGVDWSVLWSVLKRTRLLPLVPAVAFAMLGHYFRAYRWKMLLKPVKTIRTARLFSATMIGFMVNNLLPARLGEIVRAYLVGKSEDMSKSASLATIVYERIVDLSVLLVLLWLTLLKVAGPQWLRTAGVWILVSNVALFIAVFLVERYREPSSRLAERILRRLPQRLRERAHQSITSFLAGLGVVSKPGLLAPITVTSILVWLCAMLSIHFSLVALSVDVPLIASMPLLVFASLGAMIPSAPAFLGTLQYACVLALAIYGVDKSEALAFSLLYHATQFFPVTIVGFYYLGRMQLRLGELSKTS